MGNKEKKNNNINFFVSTVLMIVILILNLQINKQTIFANSSEKVNVKLGMIAADTNVSVKGVIIHVNETDSDFNIISEVGLYDTNSKQSYFNSDESVSINNVNLSGNIELEADKYYVITYELPQAYSEDFNGYTKIYVNADGTIDKYPPSYMMDWHRTAFYLPGSDDLNNYTILIKATVRNVFSIGKFDETGLNTLANSEFAVYYYSDSYVGNSTTGEWRKQTSEDIFTLDTDYYDGTNDDGVQKTAPIGLAANTKYKIVEKKGPKGYENKVLFTFYFETDQDAKIINAYMDNETKGFYLQDYIKAYGSQYSDGSVYFKEVGNTINGITKKGYMFYLINKKKVETKIVVNPNDKVVVEKKPTKKVIKKEMKSLPNTGSFILNIAIVMLINCNAAILFGYKFLKI